KQTGSAANGAPRQVSEPQMNASLIRVGSMTSFVAIFSVAAIAIQAGMQSLPISITGSDQPNRLSSAALRDRVPAGIVAVRDGPAAGQLTIQMDRPVSTGRAYQIGHQLGTDVIR